MGNYQAVPPEQLSSSTLVEACRSSTPLTPIEMNALLKHYLAEKENVYDFSPIQSMINLGTHEDYGAVYACLFTTSAVYVLFEARGSLPVILKWSKSDTRFRTTHRLWLYTGEHPRLPGVHFVFHAKIEHSPSK
jgi:hypothetical protein